MAKKEFLWNFSKVFAPEELTDGNWPNGLNGDSWYWVYDPETDIIYQLNRHLSDGRINRQDVFGELKEMVNDLD